MAEAVLAFPTGGRRGAKAAAAQSADEGIELVYHGLFERASSARAPAFWPAMPPKPALSAIEHAGLSRLIETLPDACGDAEIAAFIEAMRHAPSGDVIDLGAGFGAASVLLGWLARRYDVGALLAVDAWREGQSALEADEALQAFQINVAPLAFGRINFARAAPAALAGAYQAGLTLRTPAFGETRYRGSISLLRVGGAAVEDAAAWTAWAPHLAGGGWAVFGGDDRADPDGCLAQADVFASVHASEISAMFQAGAAVFVQLKRGHG